MEQPLVYDEHVPDSGDVTETLSPTSLDDVRLSNGKVINSDRDTPDDTYIVSHVQPGIYSVCISSIFTYFVKINVYS